MAIGVFGLQVAYRLKRIEVMSSQNTHGWFAGQGFPGTISTVDRIDFFNDTATTSVRGPLSAATGLAAAAGNSNYGWFGGGFIIGPGPSTVPISKVDRIDFSNDSPSVSVRGPLSSARYIGPGATGNSNYGWFGGGGTPAKVSTVDRIDFSNDSGTASVRGSLTGTRYNAGATGNSNYGWWGGGTIFPSIFSTVDRIDFSNDSPAASPRGPLNSARYGVAATGNSNYGWWGGGTTGLAPSNVSIIQRIDFANDSVVTTTRGPLSSAKWATAATGNSNYGWYAAGLDPAGPLTSSIDRIDFSNDLVAVSVRGRLSTPGVRSKFSATSGQAKGPTIKLQKAGSYGWFGGGTGPLSTVDRINFSNDGATALARGTLSLARLGLAATGNSNYGWFGGGSIVISTVDRIDFSNDSTTASPRGPLSQGRSSSISIGNSNYGWWGGGTTNPGSITTPQSTVDRINFSNDSTTASPRGPLSQARQNIAATGNSNYGWYGGGFNTPTSPAYYSTVDRIDFSNDLSTASPRGPLSLARGSLAGTGNSNYGWFGGGNPGPLSTVNRIDFSNDSVTASVRGPLSLARSTSTAAGNTNYGWYGGGTIPVSTAVSTVDRIDFSNDSPTASSRGILSSARQNHAATSNTTR